MQELPVAGGDGPRERADAARNRLRILAAASELVQLHGIDGVSMDDVARAACVGTGTLYRRFGDRAGLALALLDEHTKEFQDELIAGPPPLGPGVPAAERLKAFGQGYIELLERHAPLMVAADPGGTDGRGAIQFYVTHLTILRAGGGTAARRAAHRARTARHARPGRARPRPSGLRVGPRAHEGRLGRPHRRDRRVAPAPSFELPARLTGV